MQDIVADQLRQTVAVLSNVAKDSELHRLLVDAAQETAKSLRAGHKLMVAGNGGSAADAQHLVAEFVSRLVKDRPALRAIALTSGNSPNILRALELAHSTGIITIGLTGGNGGHMVKLCDYCLRMPSDLTMKIQEAHLALEHIFCLLVEQMYFVN